MPLSTSGAAVLYTLFLWWFSTGAILWLDRRPRTTYRFSLSVMSIAALAAVVVLIASLKSTSSSGAVVAFTAAIVIWGWHELSFLTGAVTGPSHAPCPAGATGWRRFKLAASTLIYHELALAATALGLLALSWNQPNPLGAWTFLILFAFRLSAKLNLFFGVPNFTDTFFPEHLRHLSSYLRKGPVTAFFPFTMTAGCLLAGILAWRALNAGAPPFDVTAFSLLFALTALALIEHAFLILPVPDAALWRWALPAPEKTPAPSPLEP